MVPSIVELFRIPQYVLAYQQTMTSIFLPWGFKLCVSSHMAGHQTHPMKEPWIPHYNVVSWEYWDKASNKVSMYWQKIWSSAISMRSRCVHVCMLQSSQDDLPWFDNVVSKVINLLFPQRPKSNKTKNHWTNDPWMNKIYDQLVNASELAGRQTSTCSAAAYHIPDDGNRSEIRLFEAWCTILFFTTP